MIPVILSGGSGSRLWPMSRRNRPKQFIPVIGDQTPFQATVARANLLDGVRGCLYICNETHRFTVAEQLELSGSTNHKIILEPVARNTAAAIAAATLYAIREYPEDDPELLIMPSDHIVNDITSFQNTVRDAREISDMGALVCLGVIPRSAHTGYGYIKRGKKFSSKSLAYAVDSFAEKPSVEKATEYISSEEYYWNSGMLLFRASTMIDELKKYVPEILENVRQAIDDSSNDLDFCRLSSISFGKCPSISIDYAVMEHTTHAAMVPLEAGWSDIGCWDSIWDVSKKDDHGNVSKGDVSLHNAHNNLVLSDHRLVSVVGLNDIVVIETRDCVLIADRTQSEQVKELVEHLNDNGHQEVIDHRQVHRPWGWYDLVDEGERFKVKRIMIKPGERLSLQKHRHRAEHWIVVQGTAEVECDEKTMILSENESTYIPLGSVHRLSNPGHIPLEIVEVQSGSYLGEDDIIRLQDDYGRTELIREPKNYICSTKNVEPVVRLKGDQHEHIQRSCPKNNTAYRIANPGMWSVDGC